MACAITKTKKQMLDKKIINKFNELVDKSSTGVNRFNEYSRFLVNLAIDKFGDAPYKPFQPLSSNKVVFNKGFFDWVDSQNAPVQAPSESLIKYESLLEVNSNTELTEAEFNSLSDDEKETLIFQAKNCA